MRSNTPSCRRLAPGTLYDIFCNPFYSEEMLIKGELYRHKYETLISRELWEKCNSIRLGYNKVPYKHSEKQYLYRGLITCKNSKRVVTTELKREKHLYLTCWTPDNRQKYVHESKITDQILDILDTIKFPDSIIRQISNYLKESKKTEQEFHQRSITELRRELDTTEKRTQSLINLLLDGRIEDTIYNHKLKELRQDKIRIENTIRNHSNSDDKFNETLVRLFLAAKYGSYLFEKSDDFEEKRKVLKLIFRTLELDCRNLGYSLHFPFNKMQEIAQIPKW